jgi:hypothetical protein
VFSSVGRNVNECNDGLIGASDCKRRLTWSDDATGSGRHSSLNGGAFGVSFEGSFRAPNQTDYSMECSPDLSSEIETEDCLSFYSF